MYQTCDISEVLHKKYFFNENNHEVKKEHGEMIYHITKSKTHRFCFSVTALEKFFWLEYTWYKIIVYNFYFNGICTILLENSLINYFKCVSSAIRMFFML